MTIFNYNTCKSFGLGAEHLSVMVIDDKIEIYTGTPMEPVLSKTMDYDESIILLIEDKMTYLHTSEVAMFIKLHFLQ